MATSYVDPGSIITTFAGDMTAGDYANFFGVPTTSGGLVPVPSSTPVQMPFGNGSYMTAGSIEYYQAHPDALKPKDDKKEDPAKQQQDADAAAQRQSATDSAKANFSWAYALGLGSTIEKLVMDGVTSADGIVAALRQTQQYKDRFVAITRPDGSLRMNEGTYIAQEDAYRQLLRQYGHSADQELTPQALAGFFTSEVDPNELQKRLDTYDQVQRGGQDLKAAFYVYAGIKLSTDDLYSAVVDPGAQQKLLEDYNRRVAAQPIDYQTWITRATEAGLSRTADTLTRLQQQGVVGSDATQALSQIDPTMARQIMDQLAQGTTGNPGGTRMLSLTELQHAFQYAVLGSAASANGLALPSQDTLEQLRQAGVDRAKALSGFGDVATKGNLLQGELSRAGLPGMDQEDLSKAIMLNNNQTDLLKRADSYEQSLGQQTGFARFNAGKGGLLQQQGLVTTGS